MSEVGSLNLKDLSKRAFSYFGGLSKSEVKQLINYTVIIGDANGNLRGSLTAMSGTLKEKLDKIDELEKHISELNARLEEKQEEVDKVTSANKSLSTKFNYLKDNLNNFVQLVDDEASKLILDSLQEGRNTRNESN